tara:strand:+ start:322 stop:648 length:327 start_codon:yes stop_codon:yes gene_type:complete
MEDIESKIKTINDLSNNLLSLDNQTISLNEINRRSLEIKYKMFSDNLDTIIENLIDLTKDLTNDRIQLPPNIKDLCYNNKNIDEVCKEFYPLILLSIVNKNFNDLKNL